MHAFSSTSTTVRGAACWRPGLGRQWRPARSSGLNGRARADQHGVVGSRLSVSASLRSCVAIQRGSAHFIDDQPKIVSVFSESHDLIADCRLATPHQFQKPFAHWASRGEPDKC